MEEYIHRECLLVPLFHDEAYRFAPPEVSGLRLSFMYPIVGYEEVATFPSRVMPEGDQHHRRLHQAGKPWAAEPRRRVSQRRANAHDALTAKPLTTPPAR